MKNILYILLLFSFGVKAQDTLVLKDSTKIVSLVLMLGEDSIRYKKIENITGPDLYIKNSKVNLVHYKNGNRVNVDSLYRVHIKSKEFNSRNSPASADSQNSAEKMYEMGKFHAEVNYECRGCTSGFMGLGLLIGPFSVIPGLSTMFVTPSDKKLAYPDQELWLDKDYQRGYKDKACRKKRQAIGTGLWIGNSLSAFGWGVIITALQKSGS